MVLTQSPQTNKHPKKAKKAIRERERAAARGHDTEKAEREERDLKTKTKQRQTCLLEVVVLPAQKKQKKNNQI